MLKLKRICITLGLKCNFKCEYCYREQSDGDLPIEISPLMREYLQFIDKEWCQSVVMSGGEPLIYLDRIKEIFSLLKPDVHKKIMTNGSLLTQDIVNYINDNNIEVHFSYDGKETKHLRGRDVLDEPDILKLVKQIKILSVCAVVTNKNPNIMENYEYTIKKLGRSNIWYKPLYVTNNGYNQDLIDGFDYDTFERSYREWVYYVYQDVDYYLRSGEHEPAHFNIDLSGNVVDRTTLRIDGTVLDDYDTLVKRRDELYAQSDRYCKNMNCVARQFCRAKLELFDEYACRCNKIIGWWL